MLDKRKFYIDGQWVDPLKPNDLQVINPATEKPVAVITMGTAADIDRVFHLGGAEKVEQLLASLVASGTLRILTHAGDRFYH